jgi:hypothetical protein
MQPPRVYAARKQHWWSNGSSEGSVSEGGKKMIWALTKTNHDLSCNWFIRWWLRFRVLFRLWLCVAITAIYTSLVSLLIFITTPRAGVFQTGTSPFQFLTWFESLPLLFFLVDWLWDYFGTRADLRVLAAPADVILATRGEYRGGHPFLPHGRFVYLLLGGTLEHPEMRITIPERTQFGGVAFDRQLAVPVVEVGTAKTLLTHAISLNTLFLRNFFQPLFEVELTTETGRKEKVEVGYFFGGAEEVYQWRNYVVAIRHEAGTGKQPFGKWKSLPREQAAQQKRASPLVSSSP